MTVTVLRPVAMQCFILIHCDPPHLPYPLLFSRPSETSVNPQTHTHNPQKKERAREKKLYIEENWMMYCISVYRNVNDTKER